MRDLATLVDQYLALISDKPDPLKLSFTSREAFSDLSWALRGHSTKVRADAFRYFWRNMPAKRKAAFSTGGFPKKRRSTTKYGGTGKKNADKYGAKGIDWQAAMRLADSAAKKSAIRIQEMLYSQSGFYMDTAKTTLTQTGFALSGLNQTAGFTAADSGTRGNGTNQAFCFPLSPMSQLGNQGNPGYRGGQKINVHGFKLCLLHYQGLAAITATYHVALLRNVSTTISGTGYATPGIAQTNSLTLFVPLVQGPLSSSGGPNGNLPQGDYSSCMRWNRADWRVVKHDTYTMPCTSQRENSKVATDPTTASGSASMTISKRLDMYVDMKDQVWDYTQPTSTNGIKGGDYYLVIWREGCTDAIIGRDFIQGMVELSYKDP